MPFNTLQHIVGTSTALRDPFDKLRVPPQGGGSGTNNIKLLWFFDNSSALRQAQGPKYMPLDNPSGLWQLFDKLRVPSHGNSKVTEGVIHSIIPSSTISPKSRGLIGPAHFPVAER